MTKLTKKQKKELAALAKTRDSEIDGSDIPEARDWSRAVVGKFYRPIKKSLTTRLAAQCYRSFPRLIAASMSQRSAER